MTPDTETSVRMTRTFEVSRDVLWRMWTDPTEFAAWYGPDGATVTVEEMDVRPGGRRAVVMEVETPSGPMLMSFLGEFTEVVAPRRLVYTETTDGHPATVVELELHDDHGRTTLVLTHHGIPSASPGAVGWAMALDHLGARLGG